MFSFDETTNHPGATAIGRRVWNWNYGDAPHADRTLAQLLNHAERARRRTGRAPDWHPFMVSISQDSSFSRRCRLNDIRTGRWPDPASDLLRRLAFCALCAEQETSGGGSPPPAPHLMGMIREPHIFRAVESMAVLVGETEAQAIVAIAAAPPLDAIGLPASVETILQGNAAELQAAPHPFSGKVHGGYLSIAQRLWNAAERSLPAVAEEIILTGHGIGAATATLAAMLAAERFSAARVGVVTFGSPPVGDEDFRLDYERLIRRHCRLECDDDLVPHLGCDPLLPRLVLPEKAAWLRTAYRPLSHVGRLHYLRDGSEVVNIAQRAPSRSRRFQLFSLLCSAKREKAIRDHSLSESYLPALGAAATSGDPHKSGSRSKPR